MAVSICYGCTTALTICIIASAYIVTILSYFSSTDSEAFISKMQSNTIIQSEKLMVLQYLLPSTVTNQIAFDLFQPNLTLWPVLTRVKLGLARFDPRQIGPGLI